MKLNLYLKTFLILPFIVGSITTHVHGQMVIGDPVLVSDSINSVVEESNAILSNDTKELFFVRTFSEENVGGRLAGQDIWYCERIEDSVWAKAQNIAILNSVDNNVITGISDNADTLYLLNSYSGPLREKWGIAYSTRDKNGNWTTPKEYDVVFDNIGDFRGYYVSPDGKTILVSSNSKGSYGEEDLYIYYKENDRWQEPIHLDKEINTKGFEISPFLTRDKKRIFFASNGHGGYGDADIFMIERLDDSWENWSQPVNLGPKINTPGFDAYLSFHADGIAYFSSSKDNQFADIYQTNIKFIETNIPVNTVKTEDTVVVELPKPPEIKKEDTIREEILQQHAYYTVQLLALGKREAPEIDFFENVDIDSVSVYEGNDGLNRFSIGQYDTFSFAKEAMKSYREQGYHDAFIRKVTRYEDLFKSSGRKVIGLFYDNENAAEKSD